MKNITLAIDERVLDGARAYAAERGTTVNALVRSHLEQLGRNADRLAQAKRELRELSEQSEGRLDKGQRFSREDAYAEREFPRRERFDLRGIGENE